MKNANKVNLEIIVVDNNSSDGSIAMIAKDFPDVKLIVNQRNVGYGSAINQAAQICKGDLIYILNPDTVVVGDTLNSIEQFMDSSPQVGIGGCFVYRADGKPQDCFFKFPTLTTCFATVLSLFRVLPRNKLTEFLFTPISITNGEEVDWVSGSAFAIRKSAFAQVGGFDERYFLYSEETDLCYRVKQKGWEIRGIPGTKVVHHHQQSSRQNFSVVVFHRLRSELIFFKKFYAPYKVVILRLLHSTGIILRFGFWLIVALFKRKDFESKAKLRGYISLLFASFDYEKTLVKP